MAKGLKDLLAEAKSRIEKISPAAASALLDSAEGTLFVDVREPDEYRAGHLPNALLVPRGLLEPRAAADSPVREPLLEDQNQPIVTYCASGVRSALAADSLQVLGFRNVRSLAGGFAAWMKAELPVES